MPIHERRQHFRIDDHIYFDYRIVKPGELYSDISLSKDILGEEGQKFLEATQYFQNIDYELSELTQSISMSHPGIAHYLNLLNAKIDFLARQMFMAGSLQLRKVNISLGGMAFKTPDLIKEKTSLKLIIYTKPKMIPIIVEASVVYSKFKHEGHYYTAVTFNGLNTEQEQLLSEHILQAQIKNRAD